MQRKTSTEAKRIHPRQHYTRRLVHLRNAEGIADKSFAPITIDIDSVSVERD